MAVEIADILYLLYTKRHLDNRKVKLKSSTQNSVFSDQNTIAILPDAR